MLHRVDFSLSIWRWLFQPIYTRLEVGCLESGDDISLAKSRLASLLINDPKFILLIDTNDNDPSKIQGHCLYQLIPQTDNKVQAFCEQLFVDTGHNQEFTKACISYIEDVIAKSYPVKEIAMFTDENKYKAFKKKYEFEVRKVLMYRVIKEDIEENIEDIEDIEET